MLLLPHGELLPSYSHTAMLNGTLKPHCCPRGKPCRTRVSRIRRVMARAGVAVRVAVRVRVRVWVRVRMAIATSLDGDARL